MFDSPPTNTMMNASVAGGAAFTSLRISAAIIPASSATPTPIIATKTTATTVKLAKLLTNDENRKRMPSALSRLSISVVSWTISISSSRYCSGEISGSGTTDPPTYSCSAINGGWTATS